MRHDANVVNRIKEVQSFPSLLKFLRDDLGWPITSNDVEDLTFDYSPDELGFDKKMAVKVRSIKQLRPLVKDQPWGIFYIDFEPKRLPVGALRRLLRSLVVKKRGGDGSQATWNLDDLLFISFHGEESRRTVAFAHFHERDQKQPQLRTFYWDQGETEFASVLESLGKLNWPQYAGSAEMAHVWRQYWGAAFRVGHGEVIRDSKALSKKLAQVALKIRQHVFDLLDAEDANKGPLHRLFASFKKALLHDLDEQRFADVLAQTFTYGLLAAKAEIGTKTPLEPGHLSEQIPATNPLLRELFEEFQHLTGVGLDKLDEDLGDLGVDELVDLLNTVDVDEALKNFGRTTMSGQEDPVVHFYEEFLKDYDKEQKVERGVFYTPKPVVSFIVRSVHEILQKEFGLEDGLASTATWDDMVAKHEGLAKPEGIQGDEPFVQILDPAVGTGTFLEACIQLIYDTMATKWSRAGKDVKAEWNRYVPEHLLPRLHGFELMMAPYVVCHMKLGLRLKELGYDFQSGERLRVYLTNTLEPPVKKQEALIGLMDAVAHEAHQANAVKKEVAFTTIIGNPPYSNFGQLNRIPFILDLLHTYKQGLNERKINLDDDFIKFIRYTQNLVDLTGVGAVGLITNNTYLDGITHRQMRRALLDSFPQVGIVNLRGSSMRADSSEQGGRDENVFDIRQGVAVCVLTKPATPRSEEVSYAELSGLRQAKYEALTKGTLESMAVEVLKPEPLQYWFCRPQPVSENYYATWPAITEIFREHISGIQTGRDSFVSRTNQEEFDSFVAELSSSTISDSSILDANQPPTFAGFNISKMRLVATERSSKHLVQWLYRPFDKRPILYHASCIKRTRGAVMESLLETNLGLITTRQLARPGWAHVFVTDTIGDGNTISMNTREYNYYFPLFLGRPSEQGGFDGRESNLSNTFLYDMSDCVGSFEPEAAFWYIYAVLHSPKYRSLFDGSLTKEFARVPLPGSKCLFDKLANLGASLSNLHILGAAATGPAPTCHTEDGIWLVKRPLHEDNGIWIDDAKRSGFQPVDSDVWSFTIGGYEPAQKWLKDRKGRVLTKADIRHYEKILYAIEQTIRIMAEIDEVIEAHGGWPGAFQTSGGIE